jgi:tetratricopeptide (TPR) repeat protein
VALVQHLATSKDREKAEAALREAERTLSRDKAALALAQCYEAVGRSDRAAELYQSALADNPKDVSLLRSVAMFHLRTGQLSRAQPHLRRIMALKDKAPDEAAWAQLTLAFVLGVGGDLPRSQQALELVAQTSQAETREKQRVRAVVLAGRLDPADRRQAIAILEDLGTKQPLRADDQFLLAQLYETLGDWPRARERMLTLLASNRENSQYLGHFIRSLIRQKELDRAQLWLEKLEKLGPEQTPEAAPRAAPERLATLELKALLVKAQGKGSEAAALIQGYARKAGPTGRPANELLRIATLLEELEQSAAEEMYRQYVSRAAQSGRPESVLVLAQYLARRKRTQEALDLCERAWSTCAAERVASTSLAILTAGKPEGRECERVRGWLEVAVRKNPGMPALSVHLAVLCKIEGRIPEAVALFRKVIDGGNRRASVMAMNNLAWLLALKNGPPNSPSPPAEALELITRALQTVGPQPGLLDTRAVVYLKMGQSAPAIKDLEAAVAVNATASKYFHLAQAHRLANDRLAAKVALRKASELGLKADTLDPLERPGYDQLLADLAR